MNRQEYIAGLKAVSIGVRHVSCEEIVPPADPDIGLGGVILDTFYVYYLHSEPGACRVENTRALVVDFGLPTEKVLVVKEVGAP